MQNTDKRRVEAGWQALYGVGGAAALTGENNTP